jgi:uncharacterized LabA/DUF88 family protein
MTNTSICRIGVFYDGSYFQIANRHSYYQPNLGWLQFKPFHKFLEDCIREREPGHTQYSVLYAAWFQGMPGVSQAKEKQLTNDRKLYNDLMYAGIEPKFVPQSGSKEKGVDVALAIDAMQLGLDGKIDVAVLVTGDSDFVPLVRALMKHGVRVMAAYFDYLNGNQKDLFSERLLNTCTYSLSINGIPGDDDHTTQFKGLFKKPRQRNADQLRTPQLVHPSVPEATTTMPATPCLPTQTSNR